MTRPTRRARALHTTALALSSAVLMSITTALTMTVALGVSPAAASGTGGTGGTAGAGGEVSPREGTAPVLRWEVSEQFDDHLSDHVLEDGATEDADGVITFPDGVGTYDPETGVSQVQYQGAVRGAFAFAGSEFYHVRLEDPAVSVGDDGRGEMTAVVSAANIAAQGEEAEETDPLRVVLFAFDAGASSWSPTGDLATLSTTPDWKGVIEPGSDEAAELGMEEDHPLQGKAWAPTFLHQITSGVRAHFYATGSGSDEKKRPAPFEAEATPTGVVPEPEPVTPLELDWAVSQEFADTFETELSDGATLDEGVLTFGDGRGTFDEETGVTSVAYHGTVTGSVADPLGLTTLYAVTVADPVLEVDDAGAGRLTALVSGETPSPLAPLVPGTSTDPARVEVATLDVAVEDWAVAAGEGDRTGLGTLTAVPHWTEVGRTFPAAFLEQLTSEARDHFRATSEDAAEDVKAPAPFTALATALLAPEPEPEVCDPEPTDPSVTVETVAADGVRRTVRVVGEDFRAVSCEGDNGIYVGITEGTTLPDVSVRENIALFVAAAFVPESSMAEGTFSQLLSVDEEDLEEGTGYSVFTWQAHTHSNTTQDTVTPLPAATVEPGPEEQVATSTRLSWNREPTVKRDGMLKVAVSATEGRPVGVVRLKVVNDGRTSRITATPKANGRVKVTVPARSTGRLRVVAVFRGEAPYETSRARSTVRVTKR